MWWDTDHDQSTEPGALRRTLKALAGSLATLLLLAWLSLSDKQRRRLVLRVGPSMLADSWRKGYQPAGVEERLRQERLRLLGLEWVPAILAGLAVAVAVAVSFGGQMRPEDGRTRQFPEPVATAMGALLAVETFLLTFAQDVWRADQRRHVAELIALQDEILARASAGATPRLPVHQALLLTKDLQDRSNDLEEALVGFRKKRREEVEARLELRERAKEPHGETAAWLVEVEERWELPKKREAARNKTLQRLHSPADGRLRTGLGLATAIVCLAVIGAGYAGWTWDLTPDPAFWLPLALSLAAFVLYASVLSVRKHYRRQLVHELDDRLVLLRIVNISPPQQVRDESSEELIKEMRKEFKSGSSKSIKKALETAPEGKRAELRREYDRLPLIGSTQTVYWQTHHEELRDLRGRYPTFAPVTVHLATYYLWVSLYTNPYWKEAGQEDEDEYARQRAQLAAGLLEPFVGKDHQNGWRWDSADPLCALVRASVAQRLGDKDSARQLAELALKWAKAIPEFERSDLAELLRLWMLPEDDAPDITTSLRGLLSLR